MVSSRPCRPRSRAFLRRPCHFAFGKPGEQQADSPCGYYSMWHRGLSYTRKLEQVTCRHCLRWLRKEAAREAEAQKANVIEGTAERLA